MDFVTVPAKYSRDMKSIMGIVTYGWGMIPARVVIGKTEWNTSLWSKYSRYVSVCAAGSLRATAASPGDKNRRGADAKPVSGKQKNFTRVTK